MKGPYQAAHSLLSVLGRPAQPPTHYNRLLLTKGPDYSPITPPQEPKLVVSVRLRCPEELLRHSTRSHLAILSRELALPVLPALILLVSRLQLTQASFQQVKAKKCPPWSQRRLFLAFEVAPLRSAAALVHVLAGPCTHHPLLNLFPCGFCLLKCHGSPPWVAVEALE